MDVRHQRKSAGKRKYSEISDTSLPPKARPLSDLDIDGGIETSQGIDSQKIYHARKKARLADDKTTYVVKKHNSRLAEIEAYCAAISRFLATPFYVPATTAYYNEDKTIACVASRVFPDYKSNHEDPLQSEDTVIESGILKFEQKCNQLTIVVARLINHLASLNSGYWAVDTAKQISSFFLRTGLSQVAFKNYLLEFQANPKKLSVASLSTLEKITKDRDAGTANVDEKKLIGELIEALNQVQVQEDMTGPGIEELEGLDVATKAKTSLLTTAASEQNLKNYRILKGLAIALTTRRIFKEGDCNNSQVSKYGSFFDFDWTKAPITVDYHSLNPIQDITRRPTEKTFQWTEHDVRCFPDIQSPIYYWPTKAIKVASAVRQLLGNYLENYEKYFVEADGVIYDEVAEVAKKFLTRFSDYRDPSENFVDTIIKYAFSLLLRLKSLIGSKTYTADYKKHIFNVIKEEFIHHIAKNDNLINLIGESYQQMLCRPDYLFTTNDNEVYKSLATNPVFKFHQYKTMLKYILTDGELYKAFAVLHVKTTDDDGVLVKRLADDEVANIHELRETMVKMPEFRDFLMRYGDYAFELIKSELMEFKQSCAVKLDDRPYYASIINSVDIKVIEERYFGIKLQTPGVIEVETPSNTFHFFSLA